MDSQDDPQVIQLFSQLVSLLPLNESIESVEFSSGLAKLEKKLLQFVLGSSYVQSNRVLGEYTLTLKESNVVSPLRAKEDEENDENDSAHSYSMLLELVREVKEQGGANKRSVSKKEVQAIDTILMDHSILQSEVSALKSQNAEL